uniref:F-box/WD repeat-containing protein 5 n=1 Tax=Doryrhamphus excisus TaxID=161450 RepID=UPI0025ADA9E9|nr:F-box/WD repeat-containing protein 5 [Doryrhamphus excisus]XP_057913147.1 F-box/WD repeat-containing protein 5 [Doryrhamphus excisus]XP_057913157.1 F-box/WD repeat-containing protein 5 [Doryrhamphus excisus]XP_057913166.1 F-box/WD repeat-containing protein 5 [Doryrhamphus excisus]XP_057913173.1 F-box/WD repeat-containing protein 5 [Doryrhamphus excisus]XP_057913181.1 F-box/WD repeat-containing protein 5 [Doryrhamphus excisus]
MECGPFLPDSVVLEIFLRLPHDAVLRAGLTCRQWLAVSRDEFLWRELFYSYYRIPRNVPRHPASVSWYREFKRLFDCIPCVEVQTLREHSDQVLHLAFSHRGHRFSSCSKDCTVKLWDTERPDGNISLVHSSSMRQFNWGYTQFSQFNADDTLLLVSGVYLGPHHSSSGEIAVLSLENYTLLSRVRNKPYDVFGCWLNETHLISGNLHWIGNMTSCSVLWLNKAFQDIESENVNVVKRLFKIQNINASTIRTVMVAHCRRHDNPDLLLDYNAQSQARQLKGQQQQQHQPLLFDLGTSGSDEEEDEEQEQDGTCLRATARPPTQTAISSFEHAKQRRKNVEPSQLAIETQVAQMIGRTHTKAPESNLIEAAEAEDKTYLLFTTGSLTYSPHQIGIKRIKPDQMTTSGPVLGEERSSDEFFDSLDHVIDIHGHIIGMGLSPDHRYLYVNSRAWPAGCIISDPMSPPPIAEEIDLHVIDLKSLREERRSLRAHRAFTPNDECFFIFLDVSRDYVASGAEDKHGYIWDRHYNICLARLAHDDVVNSVAFSPADQELLLSASDDATIKVWRSPRTVRLTQSAVRPHRPRGLLASWLSRSKNSTGGGLNGKP